MLQHAYRHPDTARQTPLRVRALLGTQATTTQPLQDGPLRTESDTLQDATLSVLENIVVQLCQSDPVAQPLANSAQHAMRGLMESGSVQIAAGAAILLAGLHLHGWIDEDMQSWQRSAMALDDRWPDREREAWPDWVEPAGLLERLRLMIVLVGLYGGPKTGFEVRDRWRADVLATEPTIDGDCLQAALLDYDSVARVGQTDLGGPVFQRRYDDRLVPWLHFRLARPLIVATADALGVEHPDEAARVLSDYRDWALGQGDLAEVVDACDLGLLRLCRRYLTTEYAPVQSLAHDASPRVRDEAWLVLRLLAQDTSDWRQLCSPQGRWRCDQTGKPPPPPTFRRWSVDHIDRWELASLLPDSGFALPAHGTNALGRSKYLAGHIELRFGNRTRGTQLLLDAATILRTAGDTGSADFAEILTNEDGPVLPASSSGPSWVTRVLLRLARVFVTVGRPLRRVRRFIATRTWREAVPGVLGGGIFAAIGFGIVAAFVGVNLYTLLGFLALFVFFGLLAVEQGTSAFKPCTIVVRSAGNDTITVARHLHPRLSYLDGRPDDRFVRKSGADTLEWQETVGVRLFEEPAINAMNLSAYQSFADDLGLALLDIPRDLQLSAPWERMFAAEFPDHLLHRVVWLRLMSGFRTVPLIAEWRRRGHAFYGPAELAPRTALDAQDGTGWRYAHFVGTPVETTGGSLFRVRHGSGSAGSASRGADEREQLLDVSRLTSMPTGLVVLQAEPGDAGPQGLGSDRMLFARAALQVAENGADAVLVIPPLSDSLARAVIDMVARDIPTSSPPNTELLLKMVTEIRIMMFKATRDGSGYARASLDVLLFLRPVAPKEKTS